MNNSLGSYVLLIAIGAILRYAVTATVVAGFVLPTVGLILMVAGAAGALYTLWNRHGV